MVRFHPQWRRARKIAQSGGDWGRLGRSRRCLPTACLIQKTSAIALPAAADSITLVVTRFLTARFIFEAEPLRVAASLNIDPRSALIVSSARSSNFRVAGTSLSARARSSRAPSGFASRAAAGRIEVQIPFNAPIDRPTRIVVDSGVDLVGGGARVEEFAVCDQYTLQGDAFSRAVRGEGRSNSRSRTPSGTWPS